MAHKSSDSKSVGEVVKHWGLLTKGIAANAADLPHLEGRRMELEGIVGTVSDLLSQQKLQIAAKQDTSREVEALLERGSRMASFLRLGVKEHYGTRSEKLTEFDLLPFRGKPQPPVKPPVIEVKPQDETKKTEQTQETKEVPGGTK